jgi:hypothetical protein
MHIPRGMLFQKYVRFGVIAFGGGCTENRIDRFRDYVHYLAPVVGGNSRSRYSASMAPTSKASVHAAADTQTYMHALSICGGRIRDFPLRADRAF